MLKFDQWMLPDGEQHLQKWMLQINKRVEGRLAYQYHKYEAALALCKERRTAVDAGAHVGLLSFWMARDFANVESFEPVAAHRECFKANVLRRNVTLYPFALGASECKVAIKTAPTSSGDSVVSGPGDIPMVRLDSYGFENVSFIKLDCEGGELHALRGGEETLLRCQPVVMVEQKKGHGASFGISDTAAVDYLLSLGWRIRKIISGDYIMTWSKRAVEENEMLANVEVI